MSWKKAFPIDDISPGEMKGIELEEESLLVFRTADGTICSLEDRCSHDGGALCEGSFSGKVIECPRHGARFNVETGEVLRMPAVSPLETYPIRVTDSGWIEIEIEDE